MQKRYTATSTHRAAQSQPEQRAPRTLPDPVASACSQGVDSAREFHRAGSLIVAEESTGYGSSTSPLLVKRLIRTGGDGKIAFDIRWCVTKERTSGEVSSLCQEASTTSSDRQDGA